MATQKRKICAYLDDEVWQRFRAGCLQRQQSASQQLGSLVKRQVEAWTLDDLGTKPQEEPWQRDHPSPA